MTANKQTIFFGDLPCIVLYCFDFFQRILIRNKIFVFCQKTIMCYANIKQSIKVDSWSLSVANSSRDRKE